ncbi:DUF3631 domain-containing protein [Nocardia sp. NPDC049220]|uniref:DUF3631 domain-containing protein n=1 Tax=Nocardia sp. NPDC049220 TaxID=3155273 RepID=UPI0033D96977
MDQVLTDIGLSKADLFDSPRTNYQYPDGRVVERRYRDDGKKTFFQSGNKQGTALFGSDHLPTSLGVPVAVVEGEKCVLAAQSIGAFAVSQAQGAKMDPARADWSMLKGRPVVVVADDDTVGMRRASLVAKHLAGIAASVTVAKARDGKDLADHIAAGHDIGDLVIVGDWTLPAKAPIDGAALLDDIRTALLKYCVLPTEHATIAVVLWAVTTHLTGCFEYAPRLVLRSPEKRSGKSRVLEILDALAYSPLRAVNATVAYIFRSLDADPPPTLMFDEVDTIFGSKKVAEQNEDLRGLLNAGFQRGLPFGRTVGPNHQPTEFETFAMAALAGIGRLPDTIEDRAVIIEMRRRKPSEVVAPYRTRRDRPALENLRGRIAEWADTVREKLTGYEPEDLGVEDRAADVWEPLISVADMAGGQWPALARNAARGMVTNAAEVDEAASLNTRLLSDIRDIFAKSKKPFMKSAELCTALWGVEESPWSAFEFNPSKLGHRLREYGIKTGHNTAKTERGYRREDFRDAFERYLSAAAPSEGAQRRPNGPDQQERSDAFESPDTLKASINRKASHQNPSSDGIETGLDTFGHPSGGDGTVDPDACPHCGRLEDGFSHICRGGRPQARFVDGGAA